jgi:hypothetical protein
MLVQVSSLMALKTTTVFAYMWAVGLHEWM